MAAIEDRGSVSAQAAADVAQMIRGKRGLQRIVEVAASVAASRRSRSADERAGKDRRRAS